MIWRVKGLDPEFNKNAASGAMCLASLDEKCTFAWCGDSGFDGTVDAEDESYVQMLARELLTFGISFERL